MLYEDRHCGLGNAGGGAECWPDFAHLLPNICLLGKNVPGREGDTCKTVRVKKQGKTSREAVRK